MGDNVSLTRALSQQEPFVPLVLWCAGFYVLRCLLGLAEAAGSSSGGHLIAQFYPQSRCVQEGAVGCSHRAWDQPSNGWRSSTQRHNSQ